jgi:hypothetical protein
MPLTLSSKPSESSPKTTNQPAALKENAESIPSKKAPKAGRKEGKAGSPESITTLFISSKERDKDSVSLIMTPESLPSSASDPSPAISQPKTPLTANSSSNPSDWRCVQCNAKESETPLKRKGPDGKRVENILLCSLKSD